MGDETRVQEIMMKRANAMYRTVRGFTIIEVMVVVAIVAIVAAIVFPSFIAAKRAAHISDCGSNMRQLYAGLTLYATDYDDFAPPWSTTKLVGVGGNWIAGEPRKWRDTLAERTRSNEVFWCHLDPNRANGSFVAYGEPAGSHRAQVTSYMLNPLFTPNLFGSPDGTFRLNIVSLHPRWPKELSETVYLSDALWPLPDVQENILVSGHERRCNRLYLDGHVRNLSIEQ